MFIYINLHAQFCKMSFACVLIYMNIYPNACIQEYILDRSLEFRLKVHLYGESQEVMD